MQNNPGFSSKTDNTKEFFAYHLLRKNKFIKINFP